MTNLSFRNVETKDLEQIVAIYNSTIASRMVTADTEPVTVASKQQWFAAHNTQNRPLWVVQNIENQIIAWVSFQSFYGCPAYNATAEISIYINENQRGKGLGKQILQHCLEQAPNLGIKTLLGFIFSHNTPSLKLFHFFGFENWGTLPNIAVLDDHKYSLTIVGKRLES